MSGGMIWRAVLAALILHLVLIQPNHPGAMTWGALRLFPLELPVLLLGLPLIGDGRVGRWLRGRLKAPARNATQDLYVSGPLKTARLMVKDEDVCLHCGLCAERCPTGAWDMQKFLVTMAHAGPAPRTLLVAMEAAPK